MGMPSGNKWIKQMFKAKAVSNGGVIRRKIASVKKYASVAELQEEVMNQEFHLIRIGDPVNGQLVVLCNKGDLKVIC